MPISHIENLGAVERLLNASHGFAQHHDEPTRLYIAEVETRLEAMAATGRVLAQRLAKAEAALAACERRRAVDSPHESCGMQMAHVRRAQELYNRWNAAYSRALRLHAELLESRLRQQQALRSIMDTIPGMDQSYKAAKDYGLAEIPGTLIHPYPELFWRDYHDNTLGDNQRLSGQYSEAEPFQEGIHLRPVNVITDEEYRTRINDSLRLIKEKKWHLAEAIDSLSKYKDLHEGYRDITIAGFKDFERQFAVVVYQASCFFLELDRKRAHQDTGPTGTGPNDEQIANIVELTNRWLFGSDTIVSGSTRYYEAEFEKYERDLTAFGYTKEQVRVFRRVVDDQLASPIEKAIGKFASTVIDASAVVIPVATDAPMGNAVSTGISKGVEFADIFQDIIHIRHYRDLMNLRDKTLDRQNGLINEFEAKIKEANAAIGEVAQQILLLEGDEHRIESFFNETDPYQREMNLQDLDRIDTECDRVNIPTYEEDGKYIFISKFNQ